MEKHGIETTNNQANIIRFHAAEASLIVMGDWRSEGRH
jgi:hypothetical protein